MYVCIMCSSARGTGGLLYNHSINWFGDLDTAPEECPQCGSGLGVFRVDPSEPVAISTLCDIVRQQHEALARLTEERARLLAPAEGVDLEEVLRLDGEATAGPWDSIVGFQGRGSLAHVETSIDAEVAGVTICSINKRAQNGTGEVNAALIGYYRNVAPTLAHEVAHLRASLAAVDAERDAARAELEELRLTLAAEQGKPEKAAVSVGVYIASRTRHGHRWVDLREQGAPIISTWINEYTPASSPDVSDLWARCVREASSAKRLYAYIEGDGLEGGLIEIGAALSAGVPVSVVCAEEVWAALGSWKHHPLVSRAAMLAADKATT